jgi:hypothetical protein
MTDARDSRPDDAPKAVTTPPQTPTPDALPKTPDALPRRADAGEPAPAHRNDDDAPDGDGSDDERDDERDDDKDDDDGDGPDDTSPAEGPAAAGPARRDAEQGPGLKGFLKFLRDTYLTADPRSLALLRIALGTLVFVDILRRVPDIEAHYANTGWLTNHFALFRPMSSHLFSLHLAFSSPGQVKVLFAIHLLVCLLFIVGWKTRLMHVLMAMLLVSADSRNVMIENGGWVVLILLSVWSAFLPLGRRFSVDALLASLKARRENSIAALAERDDPPRDTRPVVSLAVAALILQWAVIYYFNVVHKTGREWRDGTAVYYFFQQDRMVTAFGAWVREFVPLGVYQAMTYSTLLIESAVALLLILPFRPGVLRMVAWALVATLHLSIDAVVQLGPFSWVMATMFFALIPREAWERLGPKVARRYPKRDLYLNPESGFWLRFAGVVKRFDVLERVRFVPVTPRVEAPPVEAAHAADGAANGADGAANDDDDGESDERDEREAGAEPARRAERIESDDAELGRLVGESLVVGSPRDSRLYTGAAGLFRLAEAVPFGRVLVLPARLPGVRSLVHRGLERAAQKSGDADRYFELDGITQRPELRAAEPTEARLAWRKNLAVLREATVAVVMVCGVSQVLMENRAVPVWLKPKTRPEWMTAIVTYPRMFQGWSMFAPSPPRDDGRIVVDGVTKDGRRLDPLTGAEPTFDVQPEGGFRMNQIWGDFHRRIAEDRFKVYWNGFRDYLRTHHEITGRPQDELVAFEVWFVNEQIPPPGEPRRPSDRRRLFSHGSMPSNAADKPRVGGSRSRPR